MTQILRIFSRWTPSMPQRWRMTPEQADLVAKIKFPCC
jgi:hypothetical protein